jgi:hypothetical protein
MSEYSAGGVIPGESVPVRIEVGERLIQADGTVLELQAHEGAVRWVKIGRVDSYRLSLERLNGGNHVFELSYPEGIGFTAPLHNPEGTHQ